MSRDSGSGLHGSTLSHSRKRPPYWLSMGVVLRTPPSEARRRATFCGANCGYSRSSLFLSLRERDNSLGRQGVDGPGPHLDTVAGDEDQGFALGETVYRVGLAVLLIGVGILKTEDTIFAVQAWFQTESSWLGWLDGWMAGWLDGWMAGWRDRADQDFCSGQSGSLNQPRHLCLQHGGRGQEACRDAAQDLQAVGFGPR